MSSPLVADPGRVRDLAAQIADGRLSCEQLVERCLARIAAVDGDVQAWIHVLAEDATTTARALDAELRGHGPRGPLHGVPVAVKDVIDVAGLPTCANSRSRADAKPAAADATVVAHLRAAGAIILGKVHTTEFAYYKSIPPTRNPHDLARTPGGSSAGSSAAVAAGMVPLALGTQTAGSVNRPAAYTGIGAFKPSTLSVGGSGIVPLAPSFDTIGAFGGKAADAAILAAGFAPAHLGLDQPHPAAVRIIALSDPHVADRAAPCVRDAIDALGDRMRVAGLAVEQRVSSVPFVELLTHHRTVLLFEMARMHAAAPRDLLAPRLAADLDVGLSLTAADYHAALRHLDTARRLFWRSMPDDGVILLPAAPDVAPADGTTGDPSFVIPTTALGGPVATVQAGRDASTGMPVGALLLAAPGRDRKLAGLLLSDMATEAGL